jgi:hypothetical protein
MSRSAIRSFWMWLTVVRAVRADPQDDGYRDLYHEILGRLEAKKE